ncbi:HD domain-containing phosphohydrolase [Limnobacter sp.]|uniref:HD domain-containing phosphohydrolase n=1 Tax=Limnobacter sp. TaxID=2003368 RepID=UPI0035174D1B
MTIIGTADHPVPLDTMLSDPTWPEEAKRQVTGAVTGQSPFNPDLILLVDDDPDTLLALGKALRPAFPKIIATSNPREAVALAKRHLPGVVVCDQRMPELSGTDVLAAVSDVSPNTARVMLTGFSHTACVIEAVNRGHVHRYFLKPVDIELLGLNLKELCDLGRQTLELQLLMRKMNTRAEELDMLNNTLEHCIRERSRELEQAKLFLDVSRREKKAQYLSAVKVFSGLTELRSPPLSQHSKRVAELARLVAIELQCDSDLVQQIYIAGLLHDVGKIGLCDEALFTAAGKLGNDVRAHLMTHASKGQALFAGLVDMEPVATMIRHHHERFDGYGYPDGILKDVIPLGSRILAIAEDYDELQMGWLAPKKLTEQEAAAFLHKGAGSRYDPDVIEVLGHALEKLRAAPKLEERLISGGDLRVGQTLSRDFIGPDGYLWLARDKAVSNHFINLVREHESLSGKPLKVYIHRLKRAGTSR